LINRKGARRRMEIPGEVLAALHSGKIATVNLVESLALDQGILLRTVAEEIGLTARMEEDDQARIEALASGIWDISFIRRMREIADFLYSVVDGSAWGGEVMERLATHEADMVRSWVPFVDACDDGMDLEERLKRVRRFAADEHFGVREWAWMAIRPAVAAELERGIGLLEDSWVGDEDANIRRFATELTRPCGVWCRHIGALKERPAMAMGLLECVRSDESKYVRDSVGNWLNDAGKTQPGWVREVCARWEAESGTKETGSTVKRALRNL